MVKRKKKTPKLEQEPKPTVEVTTIEPEGESLFTVSTSDVPKPLVNITELYALAPKPLTIHWTRKTVSDFRRAYEKFYAHLGALAQ